MLRLGVRQTGLRVILGLMLAIASGSAGHLEARENSSTGETVQNLRLSRGALCEGIQDFAPLNAAAAFSYKVKQIYCYTAFDPVRHKTFVYHKWYFRDVLGSKTRLALYPPRWSTFSLMEVGELDKGPWRVEITDEEDRLIKVLRFSVTD